MKRVGSNLAAYNEARAKVVLSALERELQSCAKRHLTFRSVGILASHIQDRIGVARTTLTRNPTYKARLLAYLSRQDAATESVSDEVDDLNILRLKLLLAKADIGRLNQEVRALAAKLSRYEHSTGAPPMSEEECANAYMLLCLILERVGTIAIDWGARTIVDRAAKPSDRLMASGPRVAAFLSWVEKNSALPFAAALRRAPLGTGRLK